MAPTVTEHQVCIIVNRIIVVLIIVINLLGDWSTIVGGKATVLISLVAWLLLLNAVLGLRSLNGGAASLLLLLLMGRLLSFSA